MVEMLQTLAKLIIILVFIGITLFFIFALVWPTFGEQIQLSTCSFTTYLRSTMAVLIWRVVSVILTVVILVATAISLGSNIRNLIREWKIAKIEGDYSSFMQLAKEHASVWVRSGAVVKFVSRYGVLGIVLIVSSACLFGSIPLACPMVVDEHAGEETNPIEKQQFLASVGQYAALTWNTFLAGRGDPLFFKKPNPWPLIVLHYHSEEPVTFKEIKEVVEKTAKVKYDENFIIIYENDVLPNDKLEDLSTTDGNIYFMFIDTYADGANVFMMENYIPECNTPFLWFAPRDTLAVCIVPS